MFLINVLNREVSVEVALQPIFDVEVNQPVYYEALARFRYLDSNVMASTDQVINDIVRSGLINDFTIRFVEYTLDTISSNNLNVSCSFNVETIQLVNQRFITSLISLIEGYSFNKVMIEVTERTSVPKKLNGKKIRGLTQLKNSGFVIALDDFGLEHSNLIELFQFRYDVIKLSKSLVETTLVDEYAMKIIGQLSIESHKRGVQIVAEGIEELSVCEKLKTMNISLVQGYALGKPMIISPCEPNKRAS
ncbi:hypothetical protein AKJ18_16940 [Vibrio xuii]|nr:hypothetical protein AKJ18_16940 [Vibrio xuii]